MGSSSFENQTTTVNFISFMLVNIRGALISILFLHLFFQLDGNNEKIKGFLLPPTDMCDKPTEIDI